MSLLLHLLSKRTYEEHEKLKKLTLATFPMKRTTMPNSWWPNKTCGRRALQIKKVHTTHPPLQ